MFYKSNVTRNNLNLENNPDQLLFITRSTINRMQKGEKIEIKIYNHYPINPILLKILRAVTISGFLIFLAILATEICETSEALVTSMEVLLCLSFFVYGVIVMYISLLISSEKEPVLKALGWGATLPFIITVLFGIIARLCIFFMETTADDIIKGYFSQEYEEDGKFLNDDFNQFIRTDHKQCGLSKKFATAIFLAEKEPTFEKRFLIFITIITIILLFLTGIFSMVMLFAPFISLEEKK